MTEHSADKGAVCRACKNPSGFRSFKEKGFSLLKCLKCGLVFTFPQPDDKTIAENYSENYFLSLGKKEDLQVREAKTRLKVLRKHIGRGKKILDIGCGTGIFLSLVSAGNEVAGIDVFPGAVGAARKKLGDKVLLGELAALAFPESSFDVLFLIHSLEHVKDPAAVLRECGRILKSDGIVVIETPNRDFVFRLPGGYGQPSPSEHLFQFDPANIRELLKNAGFEAVELGCLPPTLFIGARGVMEYARSGAAYLISRLCRRNVSDNILLVAGKNGTNVR